MSNHERDVSEGLEDELRQEEQQIEADDFASVLDNLTPEQAEQILSEEDVLGQFPTVPSHE